MAKTTEQTGPIIDTTTFAVSELRPFHKNPRRGNVEMIAESLQINGQYRAIVVNVGTHTGRPLEVLAGNHTLAAAKQLGWKQITATTVDVDDLAAARIVAADNRTADLGGYDDEAGGLGDLGVGAAGGLGGLDGEVPLLDHGFECLRGAFHVLEGEALGVDHVASVHRYGLGTAVFVSGLVLSLPSHVHLYR